MKYATPRTVAHVGAALSMAALAVLGAPMAFAGGGGGGGGAMQIASDGVLVTDTPQSGQLAVKAGYTLAVLSGSRATFTNIVELSCFRITRHSYTARTNIGQCPWFPISSGFHVFAPNITFGAGSNTATGFFGRVDAKLSYSCLPHRPAHAAPQPWPHPA